MEHIISKTIYKCPVCKLVLVKEERQYVCDNGHNFDRAGKGHVNLLLANQKKTKDPGDSKEMMESRRDFLNKGYYEKFSDKLNEVIISQLEEKAEYILDAGCGEGYFISKLKNKVAMEQKWKHIDYYGIDISKSAVKNAAKRDKEINFAVASSFNLPIMDHSLDCVIRNFAPGDNKEFSRVLKDNGKLIIVTPGISHLFELKEALYEKARKHEMKEAPVEGFQCISQEQLQYNIDLKDKSDIRNLISMTPYYWTITSEMRNKIDEISNLITTLHFNIETYGKID